MKARLVVVAIAMALFAFVARSAHAQMSDGEKKAAARAAYLEGVQLQDAGKPAEALARFEAAQKLFDAPTHLLHIAECQALTGKLVEASETYETLTRRSLPPGSPEAFTQAQDQARAELPPLRARIPTMRVTVKPDPKSLKNLQISVNDRQMPAELVGIARPVNPGPYRVAAQAQGFATQQPTDVEVKEKEQKVVELQLHPANNAPAPYPVVVVPPPAPYTANYPPPPASYEPRPLARSGPTPTSAGLQFGPRVLYSLPLGNVARNIDWDTFSGNGVGFGLDFNARLAKMMLLGLTFEYTELSQPKTYVEISRSIPLTGARTFSANMTYFGAVIGLVPNTEKFSFYGDFGLGYRSVNREVSATNYFSDQSFGGVEGNISVGMSIPAGPIRMIPKLGIAVGSMEKSASNVCRSSGNACTLEEPQTGFGFVTSFNDSSTHTTFSLQLAVHYSLDFGKKPQAGAAAPASDPALVPSAGQPIQ